LEVVGMEKTLIYYRNNFHWLLVFVVDVTWCSFFHLEYIEVLGHRLKGRLGKLVRDEGEVDG